MPVTFWSYWIIGLTVLGLLFVTWLGAGVFFAKKDSIQPPDQVWDGNLREGNDQPPKLWFIALFGTLIFSCAYLVLYPGLGNYPGLLGWSQHGELNTEIEQHEQNYQQIHQKWETASLTELGADKSAMKSAHNLYANNCATCHGETATGQFIFPNLVDDEWQWGNNEQQLIETITNGRSAVMAAWGQQLGNDGINTVAAYVIALSQDNGNDPQLSEGAKIYATNCSVCHGANGEGNQLLGAPRFVNHTWIYQDDLEGQTLEDAITITINGGRNGIMPAQKDRLSAGQIRLLAAWLLGPAKNLATPN